MNILQPTEYDESCTFASYCRLNGFLFSHLAQETYTPSWATKMRNKRMGVQSGVPDYLVIVKNQVVFIEMKRRTNGVVSTAQRRWINALSSCGVMAQVCEGADEAIKLIEIIKGNGD